MLPRSDRQGFTLVELMIVIVVIGVLVAVAVPNYQRFRAHSYDATMHADLHSAMLHIADYEMLHAGDLPPDETALAADTGFSLSPGVRWEKFSVHTRDGVLSVHMHLEHSSSPNRWHADYPAQGSLIEIR